MPISANNYESVCKIQGWSHDSKKSLEQGRTMTKDHANFMVVFL